jgi:hypothetical protein
MLRPQFDSLSSNRTPLLLCVMLIIALTAGCVSATAPTDISGSRGAARLTRGGNPPVSTVRAEPAARAGR